jgi:hypothetical protein
MAETNVAYQYGLLGVAPDCVAGDIIERCKAMLAEEPDTREDYERAWIRYLARYHDLDAAIRTGRIASANSLLDWLRLNHAPGFRTVANRCQELIRADASLQPKPEVMQRRQRQRKQGRVR